MNTGQKSTMNKTGLFKLSFAIACWALSAFQGLQAQTSAPFLNTGAGARAVGMGESFTAVADDLSALQYNPAGLGPIAGSQLFLGSEISLSSTLYETAGMVLPIRTGALAFGLGYVKYPSLDLGALGSAIPYDVDARAGYGFPIAENLYLGMSSEWIRQQVASSIYTSLFWSFGFLSKPSESLSFGLALQNAGIGTQGYDSLAALSAGAAYRLPLDPEHTSSLLMSTQANLSFEGASQLNAGLECALADKYFLRAGYANDLRDQGLGWKKGLSLGGGVKIKDFRVDYSYSFEGSLGNVQNISLTAYFPPDPKPAPEAVSRVVPATIYVHDTVTAAPTAVPRVTPTSENDKKPVMLKFKVDSQENMTAVQLFDLAEKKSGQRLRKEALELYAKAVEKDPRFEKAWEKLGKLYLDESVKSYKRLLQLDPQNKTAKEWLDRLK